MKPVNTIAILFLLICPYYAFGQKILSYDYVKMEKISDGRNQYFNAEDNKPLDGEYKIEAGYRYGGGYYIAKHKKGFITGVKTDYNKRGTKTAETIYENGFLNSTKKEFEDDGSLKREIHFKNNLLDGSDIEFFSDGSVKRKTYYKAGKQDGQDIAYDYQTRNLIYDKNFKDGLLDGKQMEHRSSEKYGDYTIYSVYKDGKIADYKENYDNGNPKKIRIINPNGSYLQKTFFEDGSLETEFMYTEDDKMDGIQKYYYPNGKLKIESPYKNDYKNGTRKEYYDTGALKVEESYVEDYKQGTWTEYYPNGQKKSEWQCDKNKYNGPYKVYYEDGKLSEEGEVDHEDYVFRKLYYKNGQLKSYITNDPARGLIEIESYDQDGKQL